MALVEGNEILHCGVGLKVDAPPEPVGVLTVRNNRFAHNIIGLFFYGEAGGHSFTDNHFSNNLTTVAISAPGAGAANTWRGNWWSDYQGFDRNGDGILNHRVTGPRREALTYLGNDNATVWDAKLSGLQKEYTGIENNLELSLHVRGRKK